MSEKKDENPQEQGSRQDAPTASPTTQQMRTVGQRRRDAEEKLEHHLEEARHKDALHDDAAAKADAAAKGDAGAKEDAGTVDSGDVAAVQNDDSLTAADRVDLIANQVVPEAEGSEDSPEPDAKP